eukprot:1912136-Prymnesium_polylepis.1
MPSSRCRLAVEQDVEPSQRIALAEQPAERVAHKRSSAARSADLAAAGSVWAAADASAEKCATWLWLLSR